MAAFKLVICHGVASLMQLRHKLAAAEIHRQDIVSRAVRNENFRFAMRDRSAAACHFCFSMSDK